jgi:hypothetical protein
MLVLGIFAAVAAAQNCGNVWLQFLDAGHYDDAGNHHPDAASYGCGEQSNGKTLRNWFVFEVPPLDAPVVEATLFLFVSDLTSPDGQETFELRHVRTPVSSLRAGGTGLTSVYADLGDGVPFGSGVVTTQQVGGYIAIPLNASFLSNLTAAAGGSIALGGSIPSLNATPGDLESLFTQAHIAGNPPSLSITYAPTPLVITEQPNSETANVGQSILFFVMACGSTEPTYQWQFNGTNLPAQTNAWLEIASATPEAAGPYRVVVSNPSLTLTSAVAVLTVRDPKPQVSLTFNQGSPEMSVDETLALCATAQGTPAPALFWFRNGSLISNNVSCVVRSAVTTNDAGLYSVLASNAYGVATSSVTIAISQPPPLRALWSSPRPPYPVGGNAYLCASFTGPGFLTNVIWQFNDVTIAPTLPNSTCYYFSELSSADEGEYRVIGEATSGSYTSPPVQLTVYIEPPRYFGVTVLEGGAVVLNGQAVTFCVNVGGSPPLTRRWFRNGVERAELQGDCVSFLPVLPEHAGDYFLVLSNEAGAITNFVLDLTVSNTPPVFTSTPLNRTVVEGTTVTIQPQVLAGPSADITLQRNGTNVAVPYTALGFTLLDVTAADAGSYRFIASNVLGVATSAVWTLTITPAGPLDRWVQRNPSPQSQQLNDVAFAGNMFLAVGQRGTVLTSYDATNWFIQPRRVDASLTGLTVGPNGFVAVGTAGTILQSQDGTNWLPRSTSVHITFEDVIFATNRYVAVGSRSAFNQTIFGVSTNGADWEFSVLPGILAERTIAYGNGVFVAAGNRLARSLDGLSWSEVGQSFDGSIDSLLFNGEEFIAVGSDGRVQRTADGLNWIVGSTGAGRRLLGFEFAAQRYVAVGTRGTITTSLDSTNWSAAVSGTPDRLEAVAYGRGLFVAVGENGTTLTSPVGHSWSRQNRGTTRDLDGMALANGTVVVVGKAGTILTSADGSNYVAQATPVTNDLHGVFYGGGLWVAVGEPGIVLTSSNAADWTARATGSTNSLKNGTYGGGLWLAVGTEGNVVSSTNGVSWTSDHVSPLFDLNDVAFGNRTFVIAADGPGGQNGSAFVSSNGVNWVWANGFGFGKNLRSILFTNRFFVATANDGYVFLSTNAIHWQPRVAPLPYNLRGAYWANQLWTIVGNHGTILTTSNFVDWALRPTRTFENLHDVLYFDGKMLAIGNRGTVLQSGRWITQLEPPQAVGTKVTVVFKGIAGQTVELQSSADLRTWSTFRRVTNAPEVNVFNDTATPSGRRFYRILRQ